MQKVTSYAPLQWIGADGLGMINVVIPHLVQASELHRLHFLVAPNRMQPAGHR